MLGDDNRIQAYFIPISLGKSRHVRVVLVVLMRAGPVVGEGKQLIDCNGERKQLIANSSLQEHR